MEDLKGKKALVIGALGQDGQIISLKLRQREVSVVGATKTNDSQRTKIDGVDYNIIDLSDTKSSFEYLDSIKPDFIFHLGAKNASSKNMANIEISDPESIIESTVTLSTNLFNWQLKNKKTKILVGLSAFMYSNLPKKDRIELDSEYSPKGIYGECNVRTHKMIIEYRNRYASDICGLILFNHTSKFSKQGFLVPDLVEKISKLKNNETNSITIHESNKYIDISSAYNFCDGFIKIIELGLKNDFIFSSGKLVTIKSIVEDAIAVIDKKLIARINFIEQVNLVKPIYGDISMTKKMLGWKPDNSIRNTLIDMLV
jgi:GDPmannose 4,6-dehydratase